MRTLIILFFFTSTALLGQVGTSTNNRWFLDKPTIKQDSLEIIKQGFTKINIYEVEIDDSLKEHKVLYLTWTLKIVDGKITSTLSKPRPDTYETVKSQKFKKNKIIENIADEYEMTHFLNSTGQIIKSVNKCTHCKFESRYNYFGPVDYKYKDGLLEQAIYTGDGRRIIKDFIYSKFTFEYIK